MEQDMDVEARYMELSKEYQDLKKMYDILDQVIENYADAIWVFGKDGRCIRVNKAYERLSGVSRKELIGFHPSKLMENTVSNFTTDRVLQTKQPVSIEQTFYRTGRSVIVTTIPVLDENGDVVLGISSDRDVTMLARLQEELRHANEISREYEMKMEVLKKGAIYGASSLVMEDSRTKSFIAKAMKVAPLDSTVLILGETGTGKGEIAKLIHQNSQRANEAFVEINCGAISPELIESELFGYEKGAFTGASSRGKLGFFQVADKGTIFLDEISELPLLMQVKLLRALQEQEIIPVGATKPRKIDVRVIAATNRNLEEMVQHRLFREDLYYRINVFPILVAPLRERRDDIVPLAKNFLKKLNDRYNYRKEFRPDVLKVLCKYEWPGNVRELKNVIEQAFINEEGNVIGTDDLSFAGSQFDAELDITFRKQPGESLERFLSRVEYNFIQDAYNTAGNVRDAAKSLNMSAATFVRKRAAYLKRMEEL